jgi:DNA-binding transcriptional LysR family regulator
VLAVHPDHRFARWESIEPDDLDGERLVGFESSLAIRRAVDRFLKTHDVAVETAPEFDNIEYIKRAVEVPGGAAILPEVTLTREIAAGTIRAVPFRGEGNSRPVAVIHRRAVELSLAATRFLRLLTGAEAADTPDASRADGAAYFLADGPLKRLAAEGAS